MQVRTLHFSDYLKLGHMHQADIGLNLPFVLVLPDLPLPVALTQHLPVANPYTSSIYICENGGKAQAYAQTRIRQRRDEWEVHALGVIGNIQPEFIETPRVEDLASDSSEINLNHTEFDPLQPPLAASGESENENELPGLENTELIPTSAVSNPDTIQAWPDEIELAWLRLLEHLVMDAGEKGVVRVYARLLLDSPQFELFSQLGFHTYTHETLFYLLHNRNVERPESLDIRTQRNRDAWYVQQLYSAITPSFVQNSEQCTSRSWEIHRAYLPRPVREYGWLFLEGEKAAAHIRIISHRNRHLLRIMNLDTRRELLPDLVNFALSTIKAGPDTQVYCVVREYQVEQEAILEEAGFTRTFSKQAVMVKHTVRYSRVTERQLVRARESKLELAHSVLRPDTGVKRR